MMPSSKQCIKCSKNDEKIKTREQLFQTKINSSLNDEYQSHSIINNKLIPATNIFRSNLSDMEHFNPNNSNDDFESYFYQSSDDELANQKFTYQDSCVFLHDYENYLSSQEELLPKSTQNHHESQESQHPSSDSQAYDETVTQREETEKTALPNFKQKIIQKPPKKDIRKPRRRTLEKPKDSKPKQSGNKSRFNNFGGFLIGSLVEILVKAREFRITNGNYEIQLSDQFVTICKTNLALEDESSDMMMAMIRKLKKEVENLPRKQGAKKHLFRLVNTGPKDSEQKKDCKRMIREQLIYHLRQQPWLKEHVNSRDFQPKDDDLLGSKKKERHEAYLVYLTAIRQALIKKEQLPKRLAL